MRAARAAGVHVYEFALGFGPKLMTYMRRNGTEYTVRAFPLGGFVNLKGMQQKKCRCNSGIKYIAEQYQGQTIEQDPVHQMKQQVEKVMTRFVVAKQKPGKGVQTHCERKIVSHIMT